MPDSLTKVFANWKPRSTWNSCNPPKEASYICRMDDGYIKMCYWSGYQWTDMWERTLNGSVKKWMYIPQD